MLLEHLFAGFAEFHSYHFEPSLFKLLYNITNYLFLYAIWFDHDEAALFTDQAFLCFLGTWRLLLCYNLLLGQLFSSRYHLLLLLLR